MHIHRGVEESTAKEFENFFYIRKVMATDELYWFVDNEEVPSKGPSGLQIWIRGASAGAEIHYVPPDWQLMIDGIVLEKGFYDKDLFIEGRNVELLYRDYRFVCSFPECKEIPATEIEYLCPSVSDNINQKPVNIRSPKISSSLKTFLETKDLDDLLTARENLGDLTRDDYRIIRSKLGDWDNNLQAVSNFLFNPTIIPRDMRFTSISVALEKSTYYYPIKPQPMAERLD